MSVFEISIQTVLQHEGGYVNDPQDAGGATKFGVSLRWLRSLGKINGQLTGDIDNDDDVDIEDVQQLSEEKAKEFYKIHWWDKHQYNLINNQIFATKVFDLAVNMGAKAAHTCLQRAIRAACGTQIIEDGILGKQTLLFVNTADPAVLLAALRSEAAGYYRSLNRPVYLRGWLNRAYA